MCFGRDGDQLGDVFTRTPWYRSWVCVPGEILRLQPAPGSGEMVTDDMLLSAVSIN